MGVKVESLYLDPAPHLGNSLSGGLGFGEGLNHVSISQMLINRSTESLGKTSIRSESERVVNRPSFGDFFEQNVLPEYECRNRDIKNPKSRAGRINEMTDGIGIDRFDKSVCLKVLAELKAPGTKNRYLSLMMKVFDEAVERGLLDSNPASGIKKFPENNQRDRVPSADEQCHFIKACLSYPDPMQAHPLLLALLTGMRIGNVISIERSNIAKDVSSILIPRTKNGHAQRVYLSEVAQQLLERLLKLNPNSRWLFPSKRSVSGHVSIPKACFAMILKQMDEAGVLEGPFRIHDLRHSFGDTALRATDNLAVVSQSLGHRSLDMTRRYVHPDQNDLKRTANAVADVMFDEVNRKLMSESLDSLITA